MRIVVTGGAGFIGSHLAERFSDDKHDVLAIDDLSSGSRKNLRATIPLLEMDIRHDAAAKAVSDFAPHVLCHHAAQKSVRESVKDPILDADINLVGLLRMVEAARAGGALEHVLFASSGGAIYGEQKTFPASELHACQPTSPYGVSKAASEQYLDWYRRHYGIACCALRYSNVYGPRQDPLGEAGVVAIFCNQRLKDMPFTIVGDGKQTRDFIFIDDVVDANMMALENRLEGVFNVGTALEHSILSIAELLQDLAWEPGASDMVLEFLPERAGEQRRSVIDPASFAQETGFFPKVALSEGLRKTYQYFHEHHAGN